MMYLNIMQKTYYQYAARNGLSAEEKELGWKKILSGTYTQLADKQLEAENLNAARKLVNEDALW